MNKLMLLKISQAQKNRFKYLLEKDPGLADCLLEAELQPTELSISWLRYVLKKKRELATEIKDSETHDLREAKKVVDKLLSMSARDASILVAIDSYVDRMDEAGNCISFTNLPLIRMSAAGAKRLFSLLIERGLTFFACSSQDNKKIAFIGAYFGDTTRANPDLPVYEFFAID